jgi:ParB family chromosome partitioning protein
MTIQSTKLSSLKPPAANPRSLIDTAALDGLAASIRADGLLQNLVVKPVKGKGRAKSFRIISGARRYRALELLRKRGDIDGDYEVPVEVRSGLTKDDALRLATIENLQRENLPPLDVAQALAKLIKGGEKLDEIAAKSGLSPATIRRRVALNLLCAEAREALAAGAISLAQAEGLTLGDHERQRDILEDIERGYGPYSGADIRDRILDERPSVDMAVFPVEAYTGTITTDLFADDEERYFDDVEQFFTLQRAAVEKVAAEYADKAGWVEVTDRYSIPCWQYEEAPEGEPGGVLINLAPSGRVEIREGLARPQIDEATREATADHPAAASRRAAYAAPLRRYIAGHKSMAVQEMLLADPRKAKEVRAVSDLSNLVPHECLNALAGADEPQAAYQAVEGQAAVIARALGIAPEQDEPAWKALCHGCDPVDGLYEAVKRLSDHALDELLTLTAALTFGQVDCNVLDTHEDSLFNAVARDLQTDMRSCWRVERAFLERRTVAQLVEIAKACGYAEGVPSVTSFKKGELVDCLLRHFRQAYAASGPTPAQQKARDWLPEAMAFPAVDPDDKKNEAEEGGESAEGALAEAA